MSGTQSPSRDLNFLDLTWRNASSGWPGIRFSSNLKTRFPSGPFSCQYFSTMYRPSYMYVVVRDFEEGSVDLPLYPRMTRTGIFNSMLFFKAMLPRSSFWSSTCLSFPIPPEPE